MAGQTGATTSRLERRKARTRAALVSAAQSFLACGKINVPILEITQAADVGMGSFYNHFGSKEELFRGRPSRTLLTPSVPSLTGSLLAWRTRPTCSRRASGSPGGCTAGSRS